MSEQHVCQLPKSSNFQDGKDAEGCWMEGNLHHEQITGSSGVYLVVTNTKTSEVIRDDRPWQMAA